MHFQYLDEQAALSVWPTEELSIYYFKKSIQK